MTWDYELARRIRAGQERRGGPRGLEGEVVRTDPLTVSPVRRRGDGTAGPLKVVEHARGTRSSNTSSGSCPGTWGTG